MAKSDTTSLDMALNEANKEIGSAANTVVSAKATVDTVEANAAKAYNALEAKRKSLVTIYRKEEKRPVTISPFYAPYLGRVVRVSVNGIVVDIPADGQTYNINKTHADHVIAKIKRIDAMIARQKRMSDVQNNVEFHPGELHL
jgi:hypothetical protein